MTKPVSSAKVLPAPKGQGMPRPRAADHVPLVDFLRALDLDGLDLTRDRDNGSD